MLIDPKGNCDLSKVVPPLHQYQGNDGAGQMQHFVKNDGLNAFRLPVGWQYLVNNELGGTLDSTSMTKYDALVQACLDTGAYCIIDIHNYARWNGEIIGQGGPKDSDFASLWSQLATKYAKQTKVVMGIVNEPHDSKRHILRREIGVFIDIMIAVPDMTMWATSVQAAVTAIRKAGATEHTILLPGTGYTSAESFVSSGSGPALAKITNADGSTDNLVFDVHKYLDSDNSGTHAACVGNDISAAFAPLATWLRQEKRQALLSEIGGGSSTASCMTDVCQVADYLNQNSDVYLGMLGWAAGSFDPTSYVLSLTPTQSGTTWTDQPLLTKCFAEKFSGGSGNSSTTPSGSDTGSETIVPATGGSSTAAPDTFSSTAAAQSAAASSTFPAAETSSYAALDGGLDNAGGGGAAATTSSSSTTSAMVEMPTGAHMPVPVGAVNSWGYQNSSSAVAPAGTGVPVPVTTTPMGFQPTTMQTVVVSSSQPVPSAVVGTEPGSSGGGAAMWGGKGTKPLPGTSGSLDNSGSSEDQEDDECDWVEDDEAS